VKEVIEKSKVKVKGNWEIRKKLLNESFTKEGLMNKSSKTGVFREYLYGSLSEGHY
jgi:hypothetical protein